MEIIFELLFEIIGEILIQIIFELLFEFGFYSVLEIRKKRKARNPFIAFIGYLIVGAAIGGISLFIFPESFISNSKYKILNLIMTPLLAGAVMSFMGWWRRKYDQEIIRLDKFLYGYAFALSMAIVRFLFVL